MIDAKLQHQMLRSMGACVLVNQFGCVILSGLAMAGEPASTVAGAANKPVTFTKDIVPIFQEKCQDCHRKDSMAPMSLVTYEETRPWARSIKERVVTHQMPPWHLLDRTVGVQHFRERPLPERRASGNDRTLGEDAGAPQGDLKDMPPVKQFPDDNTWQLEKVYGRPPDMIIKSDPYTMQAVSQDQWWKPTVDLNLTEPRWVKAVEMRPGTPAGRKITHHALAHLIQNDTDPAAKNGPDDDAGPGRGAGRGPDGMGRRENGRHLSAQHRANCCCRRQGEDLGWDIHYPRRRRDDCATIVELAVWLYPKDEKPGIRNLFDRFPGDRECRYASRHPAQHYQGNSGLPRAKGAGDSRQLPTAYASARQGHGARSHPA